MNTRATSPRSARIHLMPEPTPQRDTDRQDVVEELDLIAVGRILWRGKLVLLTLALIALAIGGWYVLRLAIPIYEAHASVVLDNRQEQLVDFQNIVSGLTGDQATINTEVEVIQARDLVGRLVDDLGLVKDPEFNLHLVDPPLFSRPGLIALARQIAGLPEPAPANPARQRDDVIDRVSNAISVSNLRQSYVFQISVRASDPAKAAQIANALSQLYISEQITVKAHATQEATAWLQEQVEELRMTLESSEAEVQRFEATTDLVSAEALTLMNRQIKEMRARRATMAEERDVLIADRSDVTPARRAQMDEEIAALNARIAALDGSIADMAAEFDRQSADLVDLQQLGREAEANRLLYEYFLGRLKEAAVQEGIHQADSRILSEAAVSRIPVSPNLSRSLSMSLVAGLVLGAGLLLLRERMHQGIRTATELEAATGIPVMGQLPAIPARKRHQVVNYIIDRPNSAAAEAVRNLRTSTLLSNLDHPPKVIMSTSSLPGEGKTTVAITLAHNLAGLGHRVLLIEGDIRRLVFRRYFDLTGQKGLLSVLSGQVPTEEAIERPERIGCDVLAGETGAVNAADVFSSATFSGFLDSMRQSYDFIIIDTPPVLVVPDARVIGQAADAILYSVKWDSTTRAQVAQGLRMFETVNLRIAGLVLGQIQPKRMRRMGHGDAYGAYGRYGTKYYRG